MVEISKLTEGKTLHHNLQKVSKFVTREYGTPAVLLNRDGRHYLAVAMQPAKQSLPSDLDVPILQGLSAHLRVVSNPVQIRSLANLRSEDEQRIASAFLSFALSSHLYNCRTLWRGASSSIYYTKRPLEHNRRPIVALYPGFSFRVFPVPGSGLCIGVDVVHVYTDARTLAERMAEGDSWRSFIGRHFVYEFGPQWYFIQLRAVSDHAVSEARFEYPKGSGQHIDVYTYTLDRWRGEETPRLRSLRRTDKALVYNYPNDSGEFQGAVTLARLRYQTEDQEIGRLHNRTILDPDRRLERIQGTIADHFDSKAVLNGIPIQVNSEPLSVPKRVFPIPSQLFGNDRVLPSPGPTAQAIREMWRTRADWLRDKEVGFLTRDGITSQFILFPMSVASNEPLMERIEKDLTRAVTEISPVSCHQTSVVWDDRDVQNIPQLKRALVVPQQHMAQSGVACAIVVLPSRWSGKKVGKLRRHIKKLLYPVVRTKCVQVDQILEYVQPGDDGYQVIDGRDRDYDNYLFNTALDVLVTSGFWPWALAEPLHYDLHVGVDVLNNTAGFTFIGANGAICRFQSSTSEQKEKLSASQMAEQLTENLSTLIPRIREKTGALPRHLIIDRDGRFYDSEGDGVNTAVAELQSKGLLTATAKIGVVELHKSQAERLRMMSIFNGQAVNPKVGSYHIFDSRTGALCTTGFPGLPHGTAEVLVVKIVDGDLDIEKSLSDLYWLSVLSWTKPNGIQGDPIVIKLADDWLEPIGAKTSESDEIAESSADDEEESTAA